jgi:DNA-binding PadR family transcriptional regulator
MLEYIILGFLMYGDMSGYDIKQFMSHSTSYFYEASFGSIYPMLGKLERDGRVRPAEAVEGGKYKKVYSITEKGRGWFLEWLEQPIEFIRPAYGHLVRIFFYGWLKPARARELVAAFVGKVETEASALKKLEGHVAEHAGFYEMATLRFGMEYYAFVMDWCKRFIEQSDRLEKAGEIEKRGME